MTRAVLNSWPLKCTTGAVKHTKGTKGTKYAETICDPKLRSKSLLQINNIKSNEAHYADCNFLCPCYASPRSSNSAFSGRMDYARCDNQRQYGSNYPLEVFKTNDGRGWGARTPAGITVPFGKILCSYSGVYEDELDVDELEDKYKDEGKASFIMNLHKEKNNQKINRGMRFVDDATDFRGVAGFFNHTCDNPNIKQFWGYKDHLDKRFPRVSFITEKEIPPLTEIMFNYGDAKSVECFCNICKTKHCMCVSCKRLKCKGHKIENCCGLWKNL